MGRLPLLLAAAVLAGVTTIVATAGALPATVAVHFVGGQAPDRWLSRDAYLALMIALVVLDPVVLFAVVAVAQRAPRLVAIPNAEHWLAGSQRAATLRRLATSMALLAVMLVAFLTAVHLVIVQANATAPPRPPVIPFSVVLGVFLAAVGVWILRVQAGFRLRR